jgi:transcription elongation factor GreA
MQTKVVYLTSSGVERFIAELQELVSIRRPEIIERLRQSHDFTQRDDAEEWSQVKADQAFVEGRILELEVLLACARRIADDQAVDSVQLGTSVTLLALDGDDDARTYHIVGSAEADPRRGLISDQSPTGRAVLGHHINDEVTIHAPAGAFHVRITAIC